MTVAGLVALMGALQGFLLAAVLFRGGGTRPRANRWLALLMALVSLRLVNQFAFRSPLLGAVPLSPRFTVPLLFTFTPLLFLYLRVLVRPGRPSRAGDLLHFLPALAVVLYSVPFYWTVARTPADAWSSFGQSLRWESTVLNGALVAQMALYLAAIRRLLPDYDRGAREIASNLDAARFRWTRWLVWALAAELALVAAVTALQVLRVGGAIVAGRDVVLGAFMAATVYGVGYMALSQPALFVTDPGGEPGRKYEKSSLTPARAEEGARLIRTLMEGERLYTDDDLSLATLSNRLGMEAAQVSQILNERMGQSFYDVVNGYRVEEAKRRLLDPDDRGLNVLDVGFKVGFRSKAAFNRVFKLKTGVTPSEFRAQGPTGGSTRSGA